VADTGSPGKMQAAAAAAAVVLSHLSENESETTFRAFSTADTVI